MKTSDRFLAVFIAATIFNSCSKPAASTDDAKQLQDENAKLRRELAATKAAPSAPQTASGTKPASSASAAKSTATSQPDRDQIWNDCAAFAKSTRTVPMQGPSKEVLVLDDVQIDGVSPSGSTCEVAVRIRARFNPSTGEGIGGGLAGWIPTEQKTQLFRSETPSGQQIYNVRVSYRRYDTGWRAEAFN